MDKRVVFAVAGSGKTQLIIDALDLETRSLIVTYTVDNTRNLEERITEKFGCVPPNITLLTYFTFLYSFCFMPFLALRTQARGICWDMATNDNSNPRAEKRSHYFTNQGYVFHNRISKLLLRGSTADKLKQRIEKYFDEVHIDEVQDFSARDFDLLEKICGCNIKVTLVGDFYQHTFDTSRDGNYKKGLHKNYDGYLKIFSGWGLQVDTNSLLKSHRCAPDICSFISDRMGINIESHRTDSVTVKVISNEEDALAMANDDSIVKLFYQNASKYSCHSKNWGKSKGENHYADVCIVLNGTAGSAYKKAGKMNLKEPTRNKLYVACTRARGNLYFVDEKWLNSLKN